MVCERNKCDGTPRVPSHLREERVNGTRARYVDVRRRVAPFERSVELPDPVGIDHEEATQCQSSLRLHTLH